MELVNTISNNKIIKILALALIGSILLTISAKIKIPFYPVPMTMQTFVVLFLGISFGYKVGVLSVIFYLIEGIVGLPVFSNSPEKGIGLAYFVGPTMGYLVGFIFACLIAGTFRYNKNHILNFLKIIIATSAIYITEVAIEIFKKFKMWFLLYVNMPAKRQANIKPTKYPIVGPTK